MAGPNLESYNDVPSRIEEFRTKYPEGTLQQVDLQFLDFADGFWVCYTAAAFRTAEDNRPGMGTAWEPVPGPTAFTRDSEVQNAETSAWGRAIIAVGAADAKKIASREEVRNRIGLLAEVKERLSSEQTPLQHLADLLGGSGLEFQAQHDIISAAVGRSIYKLGELSEEEISLASRATEGAIADRDQLQEEKS